MSFLLLSLGGLVRGIVETPEREERTIFATEKGKKKFRAVQRRCGPEYHGCDNNYSFDALPAYCFGININCNDCNFPRRRVFGIYLKL